MAKHDHPAPRARRGSRATSGETPDALRRALYEDILRGELDGGRHGRGWKALLLPVFLMLLLAGLVLGGLYVASLWQKGRFDHLFRVRHAPAATESVWQRQDRVRPPEDLSPARSEVDPIAPSPEQGWDEDVSETATPESE